MIKLSNFHRDIIKQFCENLKQNDAFFEILTNKVEKNYLYLFQKCVMHQKLEHIFLEN